MSKTACDAKIRPFPNDTELTCEDHGLHEHHGATLREYAYPGSATVISWREEDRRNYRGEWSPCDRSSNVLPCILPAGHHGEHAH